MSQTEVDRGVKADPYPRQQERIRPVTPASSPQLTGFRFGLAEALQAYEQAQATHLQTERQAAKEHAQRVAAIDACQQAEAAQLAVEQQGLLDTAAREQERAGKRLAAVDKMTQEAESLLQRAGLARLASVSLDSVATPKQSSGEFEAEFNAARMAHADLHAGVLRLATALAVSEQWEEARRVLGALLTDRRAPLHEDAAALFDDTYERPTRKALEDQRWREAYDMVHAWLAHCQDARKPLNQLQNLLLGCVRTEVWGMAALAVVELHTVVDDDPFATANLRRHEALRAATRKEACSLTGLEICIAKKIQMPTEQPQSDLIEARIDHIVFSLNKRWIAFSYRFSGKAISIRDRGGNGVMAMDRASGRILPPFKMKDDVSAWSQTYTERDPIRAIGFEDQDRALQIVTASGAQASIDVATGRIQRSTSAPPSPMPSIAPNVDSALLDLLQRKRRADVEIMACAVSEDGLHMAAAITYGTSYDRTIELLVYRRVAGDDITYSSRLIS